MQRQINIQLLRKRALFLWRQEDTSSLRLFSVSVSIYIYIYIYIYMYVCIYISIYMGEKNK